jgi:ABC-type glycerol-3-phosphate transport system permease component
MKRSPLASAILWFVLIMGTAAFVFPLWWMAVVSLETPARAEAAVTGSAGIALFPPDPQPANYLDAIRETGSTPWWGFIDALSNSIVVTLLVVLGTVKVCTTAIQWLADALLPSIFIHMPLKIGRASCRERVYCTV